MDQGLKAASFASAHVIVRTQLHSCPYLQGKLRNVVSLYAPARGKWFGGRLASLPQYLMNGTCSLRLLYYTRVIPMALQAPLGGMGSPNYAVLLLRA